MADSILRDKAKEFEKKMVFLCREMKLNQKESVLIDQLLRSSTSIGANLHEAQYAQSTNDFISKLEIAQKECYETEYWLELLFETDCMSEEEYKSLQNECGTIRRMLISSLKTISQGDWVKNMDVVEHYDKLIDENNDPVYDPEPLKRYMDKWDGQIFIDAMELNKNKVVLGSPKVWKMCRTFSLLVMV